MNVNKNIRPKLPAANIEIVSKLLKNRYLNIDHRNKANPLSELLFILLSITTTEPVYWRTYRDLRKTFPKYADFVGASIKKISTPIREGGQYTQKATAIKGIMERLVSRFGRPTLAPLKVLSDEKCEEFLTSLPGVGKKVARCVMMYSLKRQVFPVDTHCRRIIQRLGWLKSGSRKERLDDDDFLQSLIPPKHRFSLHVNMISLGREFCKARNPQCDRCLLLRFCSAGMRHHKKGLRRTT